ncbi:MAG TPA: hypothetical protein VHE99_01200 [Gammaproteobacteria bacterium]|nr:hypothetical protein [Gammaproteobacteria bacterium]
MQTTAGEKSIELGEHKDTESPTPTPTQPALPEKQLLTSTITPLEVLEPPTKIQKPDATSKTLADKKEIRNPKSAYELGKTHFLLAQKATDQTIKASEYLQAFAAFAAHQEQYAPAQIALGILFLKKDFPYRDEKVAKNFFELAANQKNKKGLYHLGLCFENGIGCEPTIKIATMYYKRSAAKGYVPAKQKLKNLGITLKKPALEKKLAQIVGSGDLTSNLDESNPKLIYESGKIHLARAQKATDETIKNNAYAEAFAAFQTAADKHQYVPAQIALAQLFLENDFVYRDEKQARNYFQSAADRGDGEGLYHLARCFERGIGGNQNKEIAADYYQQSAAKGYAPAKSKLESPPSIELLDLKTSQTENSEADLEPLPPISATPVATEEDEEEENDEEEEYDEEEEADEEEIVEIKAASKDEKKSSTKLAEGLMENHFQTTSPISTNLYSKELNDFDEEPEELKAKKLKPEDIKKPPLLKASVQVGINFYTAWGQDFEKTARYYEAAIVKNEITPRILNDLGECYLYHGVKSLIDWTPQQLFSEASTLGASSNSWKHEDYSAIKHTILINLGYCYEKGVGFGGLEGYVHDRRQTALDIYRKAQKSLSPQAHEAVYRLGRCEEEFGHPEWAIRYYEEYRDQFLYKHREKFAKAEYRLGCVHEKIAEKMEEKRALRQAKGIKQSAPTKEELQEIKQETSEIQEHLALAFGYYKRACERPLFNNYDDKEFTRISAKSHNALGEYHLRRRGEPQDLKDNDKSKTVTAKLHEALEKNLWLAVEHFRNAAQANDPKGQCNYGLCYLYGVGSFHEKNLEKAIRYFTLSARQGCKEAIEQLEKCYEKGIHVPIDFEMMNHLHRLAKVSETAARARQVKELLLNYRQPKPSTKTSTSHSSSSSSSSSSFFPSTQASAPSTSSTSVPSTASTRLEVKKRELLKPEVTTTTLLPS